MMRAAARWLPERWLRVSTEGAANIPSAGPVLIAARHYHHFYDAVALLRAVPRPVHFVVTLDWVQSAPGRRIMIGLTGLAEWPVVARTVPGERRDPDHGRAANSRLRGIRHAVQLLADGSAVAIFPEGYPNIDPRFTPKGTADEFLPFQPGFARIAALARRRLRAPVPIIPAGLRFRQCPTPHMTVRFGDAIYGEKEATPALVARVQQEVVRLSA